MMAQIVHSPIAWTTSRFGGQNQAMKHRCRVEGCKGRWDWETCGYHLTGKCSRHGKWWVCRTHEYYRHCPICYAEERQREEAQQAADAAEAARRNGMEGLRTPEESLRQYLAEYRAQGYEQQAAEAMAQRRIREEPAHPRRAWTADDIRAERWDAEQQKMAAERLKKLHEGSLAVCPKCKADVPASQGIVLAHQVAVPGANRFEDPGPGTAPCRGEGYPSAHASTST